MMIFRRMVLGDGPTITRLEGSPTHSPRRVVSYFYQHFGSVFSKTTSFVFENDVFLIHGLGECEGVGEDSAHGLVI